MSFDPTNAIEQIRKLTLISHDENERYWSDPSNDMDAAKVREHYDRLSEIYEEIATLAIELDQSIYEGGELPAQWKKP